MHPGKASAGDGVLRGLLDELAQRWLLLAQHRGDACLRGRARDGLRARLKEHFADDVLERNAEPRRSLEQGRRRRGDRAGGRGVLPRISDRVVVAHALSARLQISGLQIVDQARQAHAQGAARHAADSSADDRDGGSYGCARACSR
jgi:hypothetical protein